MVSYAPTALPATVASAGAIFRELAHARCFRIENLVSSQLVAFVKTLTALRRG